MKKLYLLALACMMVIQGFGQSSVVYFTKDITPESLVSIYEALGVNREQELAILPLLKDFVRVEKFIVMIFSFHVVAFSFYVVE